MRFWQTLMKENGMKIPRFSCTQKISALIFLAVFCRAFSFAHGITLLDHTKIAELSRFRIMGEIELRSEKSRESQADFRTLNHNGGMQMLVLEIIGHDSQNDVPGLWLYVLTTAPMWVDSGEYIDRHTKFLIFLPDDMPVFDFET